MIIYEQTRRLTQNGTVGGTLYVDDASSLAPGAIGALSDASSGPLFIVIESIDYNTNQLRVTRDNAYPDLSAFTTLGGAAIHFSRQVTPDAPPPLPPGTNASSFFVVTTGSTIARSLADRMNDRVNVKDEGAVGDGVTDDYDAIQRAVAKINLQGGGTLVFPRGTYKINRYRIDGGPQANGITDFIISHVNGLIIEGNGSKLDMLGTYTRSIDYGGNSSYRNTVGLRISDSSRVTINDLEIDGNSDDTTYAAPVEGFSHGLQILGCSDVVVHSVETHHYPSDGIYLAEGGTAPIYTASRRVAMRGCRSHHNGRQGMTISVGRDLTFTNCTFSDTGRGLYAGHAPKAGIDIEPNRSPFSNSADEYTGHITFTNCLFQNNTGSEFTSSGATTSTLYPVRFFGCSFIGGDSAARMAPSSKYTSMYGCYFKNLQLIPGLSMGTAYPMNLIVRDSVFENDQPSQRVLLWESQAESSFMVQRCRFYMTSPSAFTPSFRMWCVTTSPSNFTFEDNYVNIAGTEHNNAGGAMNYANFQGTGVRVNRNYWTTNLASGSNYFRISCTSGKVIDDIYAGTLGAISASTARTQTGFSQGTVSMGAISLGDGNSTHNFARRIWFGTAAPTTGTFLAGDTVLNASPTATAVPGWMCTTAGTDAGAVWTTLPRLGLTQSAARTDVATFTSTPAALTTAATLADLNTLRTAFNDLLAKMRTAKLLA